jgi:hypothetical protein
VRQEVRALARLSEGTYVAANREGVFFGRAGEPLMQRSRVETGALPLMPPLRMTTGPGDLVIWGEYGSYSEPRPVRIYASRDSGRSFGLVHTFAAGEILHVHNLRWDPHQGHYWVLAGDHDSEPGIGRLSADLARFEWFVKGEQRFRAVEIFDLGDRLLYGTDTEMEQNGLVTLDKASGRLERHRAFDGSCIYACRFGGLLALSTSVEPSKVNHTRFGSLWLSRDGMRWKRAWRAEKDAWSAHYFQFGSIVLPSGATDREIVYLSGQALRGIDGRTLVARLAPGAAL